MPLDLATAAVIVVTSALGGAANAVAGGGSLLTFPALVGLGVPPVMANATSTVALWPGSLSSMWGYRHDLAGARAWAVRLAVPSVLGGIVGARLLLVGGDAQFARVMPWLVAGATALFVAQKPLVGLLAFGRRRRGGSAAAGAPVARAIDAELPPPHVGALAFQTLVAVYGGYFGAGAGILMLGALGLMGLTNIHQMNGLKSWGATCFNAVAIATFVVGGVVDWPLALLMAVGAAVGAAVAARVARRAPQALVRHLVAVIGFASALWLWARA